MAGVEFSPSDAAVIARSLRRTGVDLVEVGLLSRSPADDAPLVRAAHQAIGAENCLTLITVRTRQQTTEALAEAERLGCRAVMLSLPTSPEHSSLKLGTPGLGYLTKLAAYVIGEAKQRGFHVTFSGEDAARAGEQRLLPYVSDGFAAGADRFRLAETVASLTPTRCAELIACLQQAPGAGEIEVHCHNMLGMAVANSLAAFEAGADWISTTIGGIGERGGNTPLAELLCALRICYGDSRHTLTHLTELAREARTRSGLSAFTPGPLTPYAYAYEIPGQLKHHTAYENITAEDVGNRRTLRVRTRISAALVTWALADTDIGKDIDPELFADWLRKHQDSRGCPVLDRRAIHELAHAFMTS